MALEYIKINDKKIDFSDSVTRIAAVNNAGKSSLVYLIKFIYGGKSSLYGGKNFFDDYKKSKRKDLFISWKFYGEVYIYNFEKNTIINGSNTEMTIELYREKHVKKIEIFGQQVNVNNQIYLKEISVLRDKSRRFFFPNNNESYNAYFILSLLGDNNLLLKSDMYKHFSEIAKLKTLESKTNQMRSEVQEEVDAIEIPEFSKIHEIFKELNSLKKMKNENIDQNIVNEMGTLVSSTKLEKAITFHKSLVTDYNSLISNRKKDLLEKLETYNLQNTTMKNISLAYQNFLETADNISLQKNKEIEQKINLLLDSREYDKLEESFSKYNEDIKRFISEKYNYIFEGDEYNYKNTFSIKKDKTAINFDIDSESNQGDGSRQVNYILFMLYLLNNSDLLDLFIVDTTTTNEIDERLIIMNGVILETINSKKKCIIFTHPDKSPDLEPYNKENPIFMKLKDKKRS